MYTLEEIISGQGNQFDGFSLREKNADNGSMNNFKQDNGFEEEINSEVMPSTTKVSPNIRQTEQGDPYTQKKIRDVAVVKPVF